MENLRHAMEGALDTLLWFEESISELEEKTGELMKLLENNNIPPDLLFDFFKIFSQIRFHLTEADEYHSLLEKFGKTNNLKQRANLKAQSERSLKMVNTG